MRFRLFATCALMITLAAAESSVHAAPYASGISVSGTTVTFVLNQDADNLTYSLNGGGPVAMPDGTAKGTHTFTLGATTDTFSIAAERTEQGYRDASGFTYARTGSGVPYDVPEFVNTQISNDNDGLVKYNSPRGVDVNRNPNSPAFGYTYISNSAAQATGSTPLSGRTGLLGDGMYVLKADQSDGFGYGDTAQQAAVLGSVATANTPYKVTVAANGEVYTSGFGDGLSGVWRMPANLSSINQVLGGTTGNGPTGTGTCDGSATACLPVGQNHGSITGFAVTGSSATNDLTLYTLDEDMTTQQLTRAAGTDPKGTDNNRLWKYTIGGTALPYTGMPTSLNNSLISGFSINTDMDRGADGKFYLMENRANPANTTDIFVTDANGAVLWNSRTETALKQPAFSTAAGDFNHNGQMDAADYVVWRKQQGTAGPDADADLSGTVDDADLAIWKGGNGNTTYPELGFGDVVNDMYANVFAVAVSPDQKWMATLHNNGTIGVTPLVSGIPDASQFRAFETSPIINTARDIAFDAAGNLHYVSSGQALYRVLAPGGHTVATTSWNGTTYAFNINTIPGAGSGVGSVPEPGTFVLALAGLAFAFSRRRR